MKPLASSRLVVWRRSSCWVMCPMIAMCALVARAGAVRVRIASGRPSQAERSVGERVEISRLSCFSTLSELGLDARAAACRGCRGPGPVGSRTAQISPSPLSDASDNGDYLTHSLICSGLGFLCSGRGSWSFHFG